MKQYQITDINNVTVTIDASDMKLALFVYERWGIRAEPIKIELVTE